MSFGGVHAVGRGVAAAAAAGAAAGGGGGGHGGGVGVRAGGVSCARLQRHVLAAGGPSRLFTVSAPPLPARSHCGVHVHQRTDKGEAAGVSNWVMFSHGAGGGSWGGH
ncbi:hypothetical protein OTU49_003906 [Cherax quadricarinatus]|uniref:Secreted protein n=1 Tax=Cherax quadricarinatus TaxID=27406 RepID=A0AAW0X1R3_CHEQU